jgi:hypothetical protein
MNCGQEIEMATEQGKPSVHLQGKYVVEYDSCGKGYYVMTPDGDIRELPTVARVRRYLRAHARSNGIDSEAINVAVVEWRGEAAKRKAVHDSRTPKKTGLIAALQG